MTTKKFLRRELKKDCVVSFRISSRTYNELFLPVIKIVANKNNLPFYGQRTAAFLILLRDALSSQKVAEALDLWQEKEAEFVALTRDQANRLSDLQVELEMARLEVRKLGQEKAKLLEFLEELRAVIDEGLASAKDIKNPG